MRLMFLLNITGTTSRELASDKREGCFFQKPLIVIGQHGVMTQWRTRPVSRTQPHVKHAWRKNRSYFSEEKNKIKFYLSLL